MMASLQQMPSDAKEVLHESMDGQESLRLAGRFETVAFTCAPQKVDPGLIVRVLDLPCSTASCRSTRRRHRRLRNLERLALATVFEYPGLDLERLSLAVSVPAVPAAAERLDVL